MDQKQRRKKIILVEDDPALAEIYKTRLELQQYDCFVAYNGIIALYFIQKDTPDLVLLDLMIPDISGMDVLRTMRRSSWGKNIPVYVISNLSEAQAPGIRDLGIAGYSVKANLSYGQWTKSPIRFCGPTQRHSQTKNKLVRGRQLRPRPTSTLCR